MRISISAWTAAFAVMAAGTAAAPAVACGGYIDHCGHSGYVGYQVLLDPGPVTRQYYYVNQGPTYSGPGQFAPVPTYQETAIGWRGYPRYDGGPYANPYDHYTYGYGYGPAVSGPVIFTPRLSYGGRASHRYGHGMRPCVRYGYGHRSYHAHRYAAPRVIDGSRDGYHHRRAPHRAY